MGGLVGEWQGSRGHAGHKKKHNTKIALFRYFAARQYHHVHVYMSTQDRVYVERLEHSFPCMPPMRPPPSPSAGDSLFENPHAVLIPWRGRIEMEALDLWKGLDASVHTDTRLAGLVGWLVVD